MRRIQGTDGITMIEVIMVIIISGILITIALKSVVTVTETGRVEETKQELEQLAFAICGNPELENNGVRTDFGYVGDVGALPNGLDSLYNQPSGYTSWKGPYVSRRFAQITDDYKNDAWGVGYSYSGGVEIISIGGGSDIVRRLANSESDLLHNQVTGVIIDHDGAPPGSVERDSVTIRLTIPNGVGVPLTKSTQPDASGYFSFDSIPIGNHDIEIIYLPLADTLRRFVSVLPNSVLYQEYFLTFSPWSEISPVEGCFEYVAGSAQTYDVGIDGCDGFLLKIVNSCGEYVSATSVILDWGGSPEAYYQNVKWNGHTVYNGNPIRVASGELAAFQDPFATEWAGGGDTVTIKFEIFVDTDAGGGNEVDMSNVDATITLSDGSTVTFNTGDCAE